MSQHKPIRDVLEALRARPRRSPPAIAVYDLDSTLFCTGPRNLAIVRAFAAGRPELSAYIARLEAERMGWSVGGALDRVGFRDAAVLAELEAFWHRTFFTDDYVTLDVPYPGAVELVHAVRRAGCLTYYLTGRDQPGMERGTLASLNAAGFPLPGGDVVLRMKPHASEPDLAFKTRICEQIGALGEVVLVFENEPANANQFQRAFPRATVVLHATIHSPDPEPLDAAVHRVDHLQVDGLEVD